MIINKTHWYDGWFYDSVIAPNQDKLFRQIINIIEPDKTILDVGTGTGRFPFSVADKCASVLGIDLSRRNVDKANSLLAKKPNNKITFRHSGVSDIIAGGKQHFDYAVITYVIHEVDESDRIHLINEISSIADKIIIGDYLTQKSNNFWNILNEVVEFAAGSEHYKNYKSFIENGGINYLANKAELKIINEIKNQPSTSHLVVLTK